MGPHADCRKPVAEKNGVMPHSLNFRDAMGGEVENEKVCGKHYREANPRGGV